jgi:hypothetical protein
MESIPATNRRGRLVPALLLFALALATATLGVSGALFTDSDSITNNSFATGSVTLSTSTTTLPFSVSDMAPGDTAGAHDVTVSNDGSLELRYAITSTTTEDTLAGQLDIWIWAEANEGTADGTCDATPGNGISTYLYEQGVLGSTSTTNAVGDPATGSHTGDRVLGASASELLCFYVELPSSTGDSFEGLSTAADFAFDAEQTANNP